MFLAMKILFFRRTFLEGVARGSKAKSQKLPSFEKVANKHGAYTVIRLRNSLVRVCTNLSELLIGCLQQLQYGWMDDLQFYVLFNSISVISGQ